MDFSLDFFSALRRMKARRLAAAPAPVPDHGGFCSAETLPTSIGPAGLALIKTFEGCAKRRQDGRFEAYPDPGTGGDPWTIGWGATGKDIVPGLIWTEEQCDARLARDIVRFSAEVARALSGAATSQAQFDALVSFHYNTGAIARATLTRLHRGGDHAGAAAEFGKWVHAGGKRLNGLVRRRAAEAALYRGK
ncbi:lysozyme [Novosphingobium aquiterrae]|uniref:Lysozyme n=1 Tax=Novosphingobium aquiterrae TaxID=624388 RepID=A0ABV6PF43_9SPHN